MAEQFIPPRVRQRAALNISAEEMAGELEVTTEQLVVIETDQGLPREEDVNRAWDLALGRIVKAREDAVRDEAAASDGPPDTSDAPPDTSDALRQWGGDPERAHSTPTQAKKPRAKAAQADKESDMSKKAKRSTRHRRRGSK